MKIESYLLLAGLLRASSTFAAPTAPVAPPTVPIDKTTDTKIDELLQAVTVATAKAKAITADVVVTRHRENRTQTWHGTVKLLKPNLARIEMKPNFPAEELRETIPDLQVADGMVVWTLWQGIRGTPEYTIGGNISELATASFFRPWRTNSGHKWSFMGLQTIGGEKFHTIQFSTVERWPLVMTLYIGMDGLVHRSKREENYGQGPIIETVELRNIHTGAKLTAADFKFTLPPDATLWKPRMR